MHRDLTLVIHEMPRHWTRKEEEELWGIYKSVRFTEKWAQKNGRPDRKLFEKLATRLNFMKFDGNTRTAEEVGAKLKQLKKIEELDL